MAIMPEPSQIVPSLEASETNLLLITLSYSSGHNVFGPHTALPLTSKQWYSSMNFLYALKRHGGRSRMSYLP